MEEMMQILKGVRPDVDFENEKLLIDNKVLDSFDIITIVSEFNEFEKANVDLLSGYL